MWTSTLVVAVALLAFAGVSSRAGILASSCLLSLSASVAYAALYAYAPEVSHPLLPVRLCSHCRGPGL